MIGRGVQRQASPIGDPAAGDRRRVAFGQEVQGGVDNRGSPRGGTFGGGAAVKRATAASKSRTPS